MATSDYNQFIQAAAKKYGVPPNLIAAVIQRESGGRPSVASGTGPVGLMQVGKALAKQYGYSEKDRLDPAKNIDMGARYLKENLDAFGGDVQKAMVGYSEGTGGARQMFAGKRPFTKQAYDSMTNKNFTPFYTADQQAAIKAHQVAQPVAALTERQQKDQFDTKNLMRDNAATAPTQADVSTQQAGVLNNVPDAQYTPAYQQPAYQPTPEEQAKNGWGQAALGLASLLAPRTKINKDVQSGIHMGSGMSSYSPQTLAAMRLIQQMGSNYMG